MITIDKNEFLSSLLQVSKAANSKSTMSILSCVLLNATGTKLIMETTNLELSIRTSLPCISEKCKICIDVKQLIEITRKLPEGYINIEFDEKFKVTLSVGKKIKFNIQGQDPERFPITEIEVGDELVLKASDLKEAVTGVFFCASTENTKKQMNGINIKVKNSKVSFTALDGHRIAIRTKESPSADKDYDIIVPASNLNETVKIIPECKVTLTINDKKLMVTAENIMVTMRLIEGPYFKIDQMLSSEFNTTLSVTKKDMLEAVDRTALLVNETDKKPIIMKITEEGILLTVRTGNGNAEEEIEFIKKTGDDIKIGFNPKFIIDMLRSIPDNNITFGLINPKAPVTVNAQDDNYKYIILPVNFTEVA